MRKLLISLLFTATVVLAANQDTELKTTLVKHFTTSRDFTVKVAEAMPAADYDFKLTAPQMSFGQQLVHLSQTLDFLLSAFSGQKSNPGNPKSHGKDDVIAFIKTSFDSAIGKVSALTPEQLAKTYKTEEGTHTGLGLLMGALDHSTHHRASAEMYMRAKGITPPEYQF